MKKIVFFIFFILILNNVQAFEGNESQTCKINLSKIINAYQPTITPVISPDGQRLYFNRKLHPENSGGLKDNDEIWYSDRTPEGDWTEPRNAGNILNNHGSNVLFSITPDYSKALIYYDSTASETGKRGFYISHRLNNQWQKPVKINIENYNNKSKNFFGYLSSDSRTIILAAEGKDSFGDLDLYVSFFNEMSNTFSEPLNLGRDINSKGIEGSPFLGYDYKTLYFSSNSHGGYGKLDLFVTRRLDETWTKWSKPVNLGSTINTEFDDSGIYLNLKGDSCYVVSWDTVTKRGNIFIACLPDSLQPYPYAIITGRTVFLDANTNNKKFSSIEITVANDLNKNIDKYYSDVSSESYTFTVPAGRWIDAQGSYGDMVQGFSVSTSGLRITRIIPYDIVLRKMIIYDEPEQTDSINTNQIIYFETDKFELTDSAKKILREYYNQFLKNDKKIKILVYGHTDESGSDEYNYNLSIKRAEATADYLIKMGLKRSRIKTKGFGKKHTLFSENWKNRRVEIKLK